MTMSLTLDGVASCMRDILATDDTPGGRERVAGVLAEALADPAFIDAQFAGGVSERKVLHADAALGFCLVAHEFQGAKTSGPHDHGPSWAIYGQASGRTTMTDYEAIAPGKVRALRSYEMKPGDVHLYNEGDIHAPSRLASTRLLRVEGTDLSAVPRQSYVVA